MRKSVIISFLTMGLALFALPFGIGKINEGKENIVITREVLSGNPDAAEGVSLKMASHWEGHLLWNTEYTIGGGEAESLFAFSSKAAEWERQECRSAKAGFLYGSGFGTALGENDWVVDAEGLPYPEIIRAVAGRTKPGEKHEETVEIREYYEYYPISFELGGFSVEYLGDYNESLDYLTELFRIPTAEDCLKVEAEKSAQGDLSAVFGQETAGGEEVIIAQASAFGKEGCYYTFCCENMWTEKRADRGENSGIYYLPYAQEDGWIHVDLTQMRRVCALPEGMLPAGMLLNEESGYLYLAAEGEEDWMLYTYALEGGTPVPVQELLVRRGKETLQNAFFGEMSLEEKQYMDPEEEHLYFRRISRVEGGLLMTWNDNGFSFAAGEGGEHRLWCGGCFPYNQNAKPFSWENACAFDGERLVLAAFENWESMNVLLAVYEEGEEAYCGLYRYGGGGDVYPDSFKRGGILPQGHDYSLYPDKRYGWDMVLPGTDEILRPLEVELSFTKNEK